MAEPADYFAACRARVPAFAARHFGLLGSLRLHWHALGLDLLRAPFNLLLVGPALCLLLLAALARLVRLNRVARWLATRRLFVETGLSRQIAHLISAELLALEGAANGAPPPRWAERVEELISEYVAARHAVAELAAGVIALLVGLLTLHAITPSAFSLGPLLAQEYAEEQALATFWAGRWAADWYYWYWPVEASWAETIGFTATLMAVFAVVATFIGILTDPLQQMLGLHAQRLHRFVSTIERLATNDPEARLGLPDPYLAKLADVVDWVAVGLRYLR